MLQATSCNTNKTTTLTFRKTRGFVVKEQSDVAFLYMLSQPYVLATLTRSLSALSKLARLPSWLCCTLLVLLNLADPFYVRVDCSKRFVTHIACSENNRTTSIDRRINKKENQNYCNSVSLLTSVGCLQFHWTNSTRRTLLTHSSTSLQQIKRILFIFEAVQATETPPIFTSEGAVLIVKYYNEHNFSFIEHNSLHGGLFVSSQRAIFGSRTGENVLNCSKVFHTTVETYHHISNVNEAEQTCFTNYSGKSLHSCKSNDNDNINKRCKYLFDQTGRMKCSPLFHKTSKGDCEFYSSASKQGNAKVVPSKETPKVFLCNNSKHISVELIDDLVEDCKYDGCDEQILSSMLQKKLHHKCKYQHQIPCREGHSRCFSIVEICQYKISSVGYLVPCRTGEHLQNCTAFKCNKMFKCINSHCIPWQYVCDGKWDCPGGFDESEAQQCGKLRQCIQLFKCKHSQICIHLENICDRQMNCPLKDDEDFCELNSVFCPEKCECVTFAVFCMNNILHTCFPLFISCIL